MYYNHKQKATATIFRNFLRLSACYRKRKRFALRSLIPAGKRFALPSCGGRKFPLCQAQALASAVSKPTAGGVGSWIGHPKKRDKNGWLPPESGAFLRKAGQVVAWLVFARPALPNSLPALRSGVRFAVGFASLLAPSRAPVIGFRPVARRLPVGRFVAWRLRVRPCPPPHPEGGDDQSTY